MVQQNATQVFGITPEEILTPILELKKQLEELKTSLSSKKLQKFLTRKETAAELDICYATLNKWTKQGKLTRYGSGGRVYYKADEVEGVRIKLK